MEYEDFIRAVNSDVLGSYNLVRDRTVFENVEMKLPLSRRDMFAAAVAPAILTAFYNRKIIGTGPGFEGLHMTDCVRQFIVGWTDAMIAELDKEEENG